MQRIKCPIGVFAIFGFAILAFAPFIGGCGGTACTTNYVPAFSIEVSKADGTNVTGNSDLVIEYRIPGHDTYGDWQECEPYPSGENGNNDGVESVFCGPDEGGEYDVRASLNELSGEKAGVDVSWDDNNPKCHAITEHVKITLK